MIVAAELTVEEAAQIRALAVALCVPFARLAGAAIRQSLAAALSRTETAGEVPGGA